MVGKASLGKHGEHLATHKAGGSNYCYLHGYLISVTEPVRTRVMFGSKLLA